MKDLEGEMYDLKWHRDTSKQSWNGIRYAARKPVVQMRSVLTNMLFEQLRRQLSTQLTDEQ